MTQTLRIGTRGSALALAQTEIVVEKLRALHPHIESEIVPIKTTGDILYNQNLALVGGKGLFLKEIEEALLDNRVDLAVHSMKDVPVIIPSGLAFSCVLEREDPRDAFISKSGKVLLDMSKGAKIGTCSSRRATYLKHLRPDFEVIPLRGNVVTRLSKLEDNALDGIILAVAGLKRLNRMEVITEILEPDVMIPAVTQGVIGLEHRVQDERTAALIAPLHHQRTMYCVIAERAFMRKVQGNCTTPVAAYAVFLDKSGMRLYAMYAGELTKGVKKTAVVEAEVPDLEAAEALGAKAAEAVLGYIKT